MEPVQALVVTYSDSKYIGRNEEEFKNNLNKFLDCV